MTAATMLNVLCGYYEVLAVKYFFQQAATAIIWNYNPNDGRRMEAFDMWF